MLQYLKDTWYFYLIRVLLFVAEILLFLILASKVQLFLWSLFKMGAVGMLVGGLFGLIFSYAILAYIDRFILFVLKIWNISAAVSSGPNSDVSTGVENIKKYFPEIGTVVIANKVLRQSSSKLFQAISDEIKDIPYLQQLHSLQDNFIVKRILRNIVDFADECALFYVFRNGDSSENSMLTLGRGVLFYIKCFPKMLLNSVQIFLIVDIAFAALCLVLSLPLVFAASGIVRTLFMLFIAVLIAKLANKMLVELIKMGFMLTKFEDLMEEDSYKRSKSIENQGEFETFEDDGEEEEDHVMTGDEMFSDLLAASAARCKEIERKAEPAFTEFKFDDSIEDDDEEPNELGEENPNTVRDIVDSIADMDADAIAKELQKIGLTNFYRFFSK